MTPSAKYQGGELELFAGAMHWKSYVRDMLHPYLGRRVAEIGAGVGGTTSALCRGGDFDWYCVEPDPELASKLRNRINAGDLPDCCHVQLGTVESLSAEAPFDSVLYIDVLEHIRDDRQELQNAKRLLSPDGRLIVLSPAHQWLYSPFDRAIGHFRRYSRRSLIAVGDIAGLRLESCFYLDSAGMLASLANRLVLRQSQPTARQIRFWDSRLVPVSRRLDQVVCHKFGKSVVGIWRA